MKKALSIILAAVSLLSALTVGSLAAADEPDLCFAVASDLHYNLPEEELEKTNDDPVFWYANRRAAMENESGFIIDEFLNQCAENDAVEFVLISGDLADHGKTVFAEHQAVAEKLRKFEAETGKTVFVINGNHDASLNENDTQFSDFIANYSEFGYDKALETLEGTCSYTADLGEKYRLIALDSCSESKSTEDGMNKEKINWVIDQAQKAYDDGKYPILMMHHNLLDHMPLQRILSHDFIIRNHLATASRFADNGIKIVLTGHEHCSDATSYISAKGNVIYDFATTSLTMYPLQYRVFTLNDDEVKYEAKTVEKIDTEALAEVCPQLNATQFDAMNADLNEYAKNFLKKGIEYRLALSLSMEKIGIAEGEAFYNLVNTAVGGLTGLLEMPLYGEGGVQELAKGYGIDIPDTQYKTGWDLATELVSYHYAGSEPFDLESTEVVMLLRMVDLILLDDLSTVNDDVFLGAANKLFSIFGTESIVKDLTKAGAKVLGPVTAGEYFLLAIASPLLAEFASDDDGVEDNNGTLPGYGTESNKSENILDKIKGIIEWLMAYLKNIVTYMSRIFIK